MVPNVCYLCTHSGWRRRQDLIPATFRRSTERSNLELHLHWCRCPGFPQMNARIHVRNGRTFCPANCTTPQKEQLCVVSTSGLEPLTFRTSRGEGSAALPLSYVDTNTTKVGSDRAVTRIFPVFCLRGVSHATRNTAPIGRTSGQSARSQTTSHYSYTN